MNRFSKTLPVFVFAVSMLVALPALAGTADVGHMAPDFALVDHHGKTHKLSDYEGKIVVLEWTNPQCPYVQRHYAKGNTTMLDLAAQFGEQKVVWLAIDSSNFVTAESASKWAEEAGIPYPILLDPKGEVGRTYGAKTTPHMYVIDTDGTLLYDGAIDDDRAGKSESPHNYVAAALQSAVKGEAPAEAQTKPYGCSVKYAKAEKTEKSEKKSAASR